MPTCRDICNRALRSIGRLGAGREPRTADQTDTLAAFQGMILSWVNGGVFGRLADVIPNTDMVAGENMRIMRDPDVVTVSLPDVVPTYFEPRSYNREVDPIFTNYEGVDGNSRPPRDGAVVQIMDTVGGQVETWVYDGTGRQWTALERLQLDSTAPFSGSDPQGLSACLAAEIADMFGAEVGAATVRQAVRFTTALTQSPSRPRTTLAGVYC